MRIEELSKINSSDIKRVSENPDLKTNMLEFGFEIIDLEEVKNNNYNLVGSEYRKTKNIISYLPKKTVIEQRKSKNVFALDNHNKLDSLWQQA